MHLQVFGNGCRPENNKRETGKKEVRHSPLTRALRRNIMSTAQFDVLRLHRLGLGPLWLCSLPPPGGSGWLLLPGRSAASSAPGFLATQASCSQIRAAKLALHAKQRQGVFPGVLTAFQRASHCFPADCQPRSCARRCSNLLWESSPPSWRSGVEELCAVAFEFCSGRRPRGWGPQRARGLSPLKRSGSRPSLFRLISEYGQLT